MHIILKSFKGSPDGFTVNEYTKGQEIELPASLVEVAETENWARPKKASKPKASEKSVQPAQVESVAAAAVPADLTDAESTEETAVPAVQGDSPQE